MNVLIVCDFAPIFPGSFFRSQLSLAKYLREKGHSLHFIFPLKRDYLETLKDFGELTYCSSFLGKKFDYNLLRLVYQICKNQRIDIIHTNFGLAAPVAASLTSGLLCTKHIAHERSLSNNYLIENPVRWKKILARITFTILQTIGHTNYIAISQDVKESLMNYNGIRASKIKIIPNAIHISPSDPPCKNRAYEAINNYKSKGYFIVGMTAHFGPQKDHRTFINAAEIVLRVKPKTCFVLIGGNLVNDKERLDVQYLDYIQEKKLNQNFILTGELKNPVPFMSLFSLPVL